MNEKQKAFYSHRSIQICQAKLLDLLTFLAVNELEYTVVVFYYIKAVLGLICELELIKPLQQVLDIKNKQDLKEGFRKVVTDIGNHLMEKHNCSVDEKYGICL
ncbi:hypothetical protein J3Q64DRAFT_1694664 [Phycomyces blakesleeanus]|uniref:Uncharacterized protein n=2 Tax=Phycomyces blakesleeanus TaxID=4837 RepID=A0A167QRR7_PHYB8|nr:hypothetical protein PHYBLDRAFT_163198 [Phycomyces blakesleeanus NRRL 1555(-)]OAD80159.1 hypothetical protein PHYBLDRAFT_163198 [Phycomyces blakesleeanus NRRL 1555(-)]|eukprot:XP_018298199.1 hypothetical protein PHYBLDRAFT_163198 [Phycomyces blakesleeanus NRRL 1555(-)]